MHRRSFLSGLVALSILPKAHAASFEFPDLNVYTAQGKEINLSTILKEYSGKPLLLHAWASYCRPCIADIPILQDLETSISSLGIYFMNNSLDEDLGIIQTIQQKERYQGKNIFLPQSSQKILLESYQKQIGHKFVIPAYFILSEEGTCILIEEGTLGSKERLQRIKSRIEELLN